MEPDSDRDINCRGFIYPNCLPFSRDRGWSLNCYGYRHPFSLTRWWKPNRYNYCYSLSSTRCRNSYDYNYCYSLSCGPKSHCYSSRYGNSFACSGNSYDYGYSDSFSFPRFGNTYNYGYSDTFPCCWNSFPYGHRNPFSFSCSGNSFSYDHCNPFPCSGNSYGYGYGYGYSLSFSCSGDPQYYQYTFTQCNREPHPRCVVVRNTYGHLDVYPDSLSYSSGVSDSLSHSSGLSKSLSYGSGDRNADADRFQYSRPPCLSDRNSVGNKHPLQQSPVSGCFRRKYRVQQYWNDRRFRNRRCSPGCRSNYSRFLPHGQPSSPHRISSSLPNSSNNHEHSPCLLPGRCGGGSSHHDGSATDVLCSSH